MVRPSTVLLDWDLNVCLRCHVRQHLMQSSRLRSSVQTTRHISTQSRRSADPSATSSHARPQGALLQPTKRTLHASASKSLKQKRDVKPFWEKRRPAGPGSRTSQVPPSSSYGVEDIEGQFKSRGNVRAKLRQWLRDQKAMSDPPRVLLPEEPRDIGNGINNSLTRPEDLTDVDLETVQGLSEEVEEALAEFDRITDQPDDVVDQPDRLHTGDLVELNFNFGVPVFAIYLGYSDGNHYQFFANTGRFFFTTGLDIIFKTDSFVKEVDVQAITAYLPRGAKTTREHKDMAKDLPEQVSLPLLSKLVSFQNAVERVYREYYSKIEAAQSRLAHPTDMMFMKVEDITKEILGTREMEDGKHPPHVIYAMTNALVKQSFGFVYAYSKSHSNDHLLAVYSREDVVALMRVQECVRAYQELAALEAGHFGVPRVVSTKAQPLKDFADKSRKIMEHSRRTKRAAPDGSAISYSFDANSKGLEDHSDRKLPAFSPSDLDIIRVLKLHGLAGALSRHPTLQTIPNIVMRIVGDYAGPELAEKSTLKFLVEIGVLSPFYNRLAFDHYVWGPAKELDGPLWELDEKVKAGVPVKDVVDFQDSMAHLRKDWGSLPVFCIDSEATTDVDDGISFEAIPDSAGEVWVHVHVAHISSLIKPDSLLGKVARHRLNTQYFSGGRLPMLPSWAISGSSLAAGKPVITFSARLDSESKLQEVKVQPGVIRNVLQVSPTLIDRDVFDVARDYERTSRIVAGPQLTESSQNTRSVLAITDDQKGMLKQLYTVCGKLQELHPMNAFHSLGVSPRTDASVDVYAQLQGGTQYASVGATPTQPSFTRIDPSIVFQTYENKSTDFDYKSPARTIVEEAMLLCGSAAGQWAADRGIPLIYTGTRTAAEGLEDNTARIRHGIEHERTRGDAISALFRFYGGSKQSSTPIQQRFVGSPHWTKITSPIRKYTDLVSLWQIDAAVRREAIWGESLLGNKDASFLPFSKSDLDDLINLCSARQATQKNYQIAEKKHWKFQFFLRAHVLGDVDIPKPMLCRIGGKSLSNPQLYKGQLFQYGVTCAVDTSKLEDNHETVQGGQIWAVELESVNMERRTIRVVPLHRTSNLEHVHLDLGNDIPESAEASSHLAKDIPEPAEAPSLVA